MAFVRASNLAFRLSDIVHPEEQRTHTAAEQLTLAAQRMARWEGIRFSEALNRCADEFPDLTIRYLREQVSGSEEAAEARRLLSERRAGRRPKRERNHDEELEDLTRSLQFSEHIPREDARAKASATIMLASDQKAPWRLVRVARVSDPSKVIVDDVERTRALSYLKQGSKAAETFVFTYGGVALSAAQIEWDTSGDDFPKQMLRQGLLSDDVHSDGEAGAARTHSQVSAQSRVLAEAHRIIETEGKSFSEALDDVSTRNPNLAAEYRAELDAVTNGGD